MRASDGYGWGMGSGKDVAVEIDLAVRRVVARYSHLVDDRDFDAVTELFTEDGKVIVAGEQHTGRSAIKAWLEHTPTPLQHQVTNVVVSNGAQSGNAHAVCDLVLLRKADNGWSVLATGRYHDTLVGEGRDMRFTQRIITFR